MAGGEGARRALAMDEHFHSFAVDVVELALGDVVRHVVHDAQVKALYLSGKYGLEGLAHLVGEQLTVRPGVVGRGNHGREVGLPFGRVKGRAHQLPVGQCDAVLANGLLKELHVVRTNLVAEPPTPAVNLHHDLALPKPKGRGHVRVEHLVHDVDFREVVARAQRADLGAPSLASLLAHLARIRALHRAPFLGVTQVLRPRVPAFQGPACAPHHEFIQFLIRKPHKSLYAHPAGHILVQCRSQIL